MAIKYKWLAGQLRELAARSMEQGIEKFPSEAELCLRYGVSRQTVRQALALLETERLIIKKKGSGSYITGLSADPSGNQAAILLASSQDYLYPGLIADLQAELGQDGFKCQVYVTGGNLWAEREILTELLASPPRGLIVEGIKSALPNPSLDLYLKFQKKKIPLLFLRNGYPGLSECIRVKPDHISGAALLVRYLAGQGHWNIGTVFQADECGGLEQFQGVLDGIQEQGLPMHDRQFCWFLTSSLNRLRTDGDRGFLRQMIHESLHACSAVICGSDEIAYALICELERLHIRVPETITVVSFDNSYLARSGAVFIPSLSHAPHEMGRTAARTLIKMLKGLPVKSREIPWKLHI